ncbi:amino acid adenylation domain-containing protein [Xanthomonas sp. NCPPB 2654]|uniref:non-ribosomal peptide synthetase n=1 Tax=Xanthomonas sp. NCPPB 2654 TaxID=487541 RepID=UPI0031F32C90
MATIWQDLLGLAQVGRHDHFFELGGHSLLIIGLIERLRQHGLRADVRMVFMTPILCALAEQLAGDPQTTQRMDIAPNQITTETTSIVPELLPLVRLSQEQIDGIVAGVPGGVSNVQDIYPLAPLQEGILFHHLLGGEGDAYLVRTVATFDRRERLDDFLSALQAVIDRHDILRSSMHWEGLPRPVQVVQRRAPLKIVEVALAAGIAAAPQLLARTDPRRIRLDLRYAPLLTAYTAADPASGEWMLALLSHHIIDDNYSMQILLKEMRWLMQGRGDLLAAPLPYRNFIASAQTVPDAAHEAYFRKRLGDVEEPTAPYGVLNVQGDGGSVGEAQVQLDEALSQRIRDAARRQGATPAALFHLAWARVLGQCSGRDDVVFGTVLSGRMQHSFDAESVVGVFINTLPIRIAFEGTGVGEMVRATHRNLSELLTHEQASLALAQRCSAVPLPLPLFTALMNYRHGRGEARRQDDSTGRAWEGIRVVDGEERTNYPLAVSVDDLQQGFRLTVQSAAGIDPATLASYLETVVHGLVEALESEPQRPLRQLPLMPAAARDRVLVEFNATRAEYPQDQLIHEVFEAQAAEHPDAIAVECDGRCLSYGELNRRANQVAHRLIALGVRPDERVAICVERSFDMVIGLLGVLKAGGAYVPLDPNYPAERLAYLLEDSAPVAMLIRSRLQEGTPMPASSGRPVLALEEVASSAQFEHAHDPRIPGLTARNLAYVIYTSGSTGKPKGVMVEHRSVLRLVINSGYAPIAATDCVGHGSNPAFDASVWEIWGALLNGARLLVIPQSVLMDAHALNRLLTGARVTVILLTTGLFNEYAAMLGPAFAGLKYLLVGGDVLDARNAARLMSGARPPQHLVNAYGPTETTTIATTFEVETASPAGRSVPIGRPIANTHVYILDEQGEPVPPGVSGELHIGGPGVARGYLNRAELTAQRFLVDPFVNDEEARMYKTGDLGRWLPDGNIEYLGRNDSQVKIRGFRIELGEIEAWLAACPKVRDAVVVAHEHSVGDKRLVAYVVAADDGFSIGELREHLRRDLPDYMIPGAFVRLDALPLTPNGKLDRKALPAPDQLSQGSREYEAPVGDTEVAMAQIFRELLNLPQVGRDDHFFELGGHSLLAIRMIHAIKLRFAVSLPLASIFSSPSVKALAEMVEQDRHSESSLVPLQTSGSQRPLFCFHPVGGHVSVYRALAGCFAGRCPVYGVQSPEVAGSRLRIDSMQDMAMAYATAIRAAQPVGPYRLLGWSTGGLIAAETARYLAENGDTVDYLGLIDVHTNFGDAARSEEQLLRKAALVELRASGVSPGEWAGTEAPPALEAIAGLLEADFSGAAPELLAWGLSGFDRAAFDHLKTQVPITAHHLALVSAFRPDPVDVPVQAFWANESVVMSGPDPHPARIQIGAVETQAIDTDHDGLLRAPHVERVAAAILAFLERSERSPQTAQAAGRIARAPLEANP